MFIGFLSGGCPRGRGNWGTLRIPREDLGTLGNIRETPPLGPTPLNNPIICGWAKLPYKVWRERDCYNKSIFHRWPTNKKIAGCSVRQHNRKACRQGWWYFQSSE